MKALNKCIPNLCKGTFLIDDNYNNQIKATYKGT